MGRKKIPVAGKRIPVTEMTDSGDRRWLCGREGLGSPRKKEGSLHSRAVVVVAAWSRRKNQVMTATQRRRVGACRWSGGDPYRVVTGRRVWRSCLLGLIVIEM